MGSGLQCDWQGISDSSEACGAHNKLEDPYTKA